MRLSPPEAHTHASGLLRWLRSFGPTGVLELVASSSGLVGVSFCSWGDPGDDRLGPPPAHPRAHAAILAQAEVYLLAWMQRGPTGAMPQPPALDLRGLSDFTCRVLAATRAIPWGSTRSYGQVAVAIGQPGGARAVGQALGRNPLPIIIPCHRVLGQAGIGGFTPGVGIKRHLLGLEGHALQERL